MNYYERYLLEDEEFVVSANGKKTTIGEYVSELLLEDKYYDTILPRLPIKVKSTFAAYIMQMPEHRKRREDNYNQIDKFERDIVVYCLYR